MTERERVPELTPYAVIFPYIRMGRSLTGFTVDRTGGKFGPFENQMFIGDFTLSLIMRATTEQVLDPRTRLLRADPRASRWRDCLAPLGGAALGADSLVADDSPISELLNVAFAAHELTAEHADDVMRFLDV